jgi:hypothetical protein
MMVEGGQAGFDHVSGAYSIDQFRQGPFVLFKV